MPLGVRLKVADGEGRPLPAATIEWEIVGRNAQLLAPATRSNAAGVATAGWQLGTDAAEEQLLRATVRSSGTEGQIVIRARAVPHIVEQVRLAIDTPAVVRLGDTMTVSVVAVDPYGNVFPAPDLALFVLDTSLASPGVDRVIGGRRGHTMLRATSQGISAAVPLFVTQYVAAIIPVSDSLRFSALGAERPVAYVVRDDRGRVVADTTVAISIADPSVAQLEGEFVRSLATGVTTLRLALGPATATIVVGVQQRVGSLALVRDTIRLDALRDTTTVNPIVHDSMGAPIANADLVYDVSDRQVAKFSSGRTLEALSPGAARVIVRDPSSGVSTSAPVIVQQVIASIDLPSPEIAFDALGDTLTLAAIARDRLGSIVPGASLTYSVADTGVVAFGSGSQLRSVAPGHTQVVVTDRESGIVGTAVVDVVQRPAALRLAVDSVSFDALGDTIPVAFSVLDRLGSPISNSAATFRSTDVAVIAVSVALSGDGMATSQDNGSALLIAESPDGLADTLQVTVAQRVSAMLVGRDTLTFESLRAVQAAQVVPVDRRGAAVRNAILAYTVEDTTIAAVDQAGHVEARANGATRVLVVSDGDTAVINLQISQRPVRVVASPDTIRFDALDDARTVTAEALDSLGSAVAGGVTSVIPSDSTVADTSDAVTLVARGNGVSTASVTVAGIAGQVVVVVDQVATTLNVAVTFGNAIITLSVGDTLPLSCYAMDRNGYPIAREPVIGSVKGTVTGSGCHEAVIRHSGYDTLVVSMGVAQSRVPVIVAAAPDSVGVMAAAQPLSSVTSHRYLGEDLGDPSILALRPLVAEILAAYGSPAGNLDRARAIRDWVARTAVYPEPSLHPNNSSANLSVLPQGSTWADVNALKGKQGEDNDYWWQQYNDGYLMLDRLLGTLDPATGLRANDGMMEHVTGARYRIRDIDAYRYPLCSYLVHITNTLWAAAGLHGILVSILNHDAAAVFIPELGEWIYEDPSFNEEYLLDGIGQPLSAPRLLELSTAGAAARLRATKMTGPSFDPEVYADGPSYLGAVHPEGMLIMGSQLNRRRVGIRVWDGRSVQIDVPALAAAPAPWSDPNSYVRVTASEAYPDLGVIVQDVVLEDSVYLVHLSSAFPNYQGFERRLFGQNWESVDSTDVLPVGAYKVEYRSVDAVGNVSASALLDVWAPRTDDFVQLALPGTLRAQARYYVSP
jgi:hypothetical protein